MSILDALVTLLDSTVDLDDIPNIRRARRVLTKKVDRMRIGRERRFARKYQPGSTHKFP